jgi:hypothetical protein
MLSWMQSADNHYTWIYVVNFHLGMKRYQWSLKFSILEHQLMFFFDVVIGEMIESFMVISNRKLFNKNAIYATICL